MPALSLRSAIIRALPALVAGLSVAGIAIAQERKSTRKLHEDLTVPEAQRARTSERIRAGNPVIGPDPRAKQNPTAIASQDKLVPKPKPDADKAPSEPVHGKGGFAADRQTEAKLDYKTGAEDQLKYIEVYNPSIVPFKRMSSLAAVKADFTLGNESFTRTDLRVGGKAQPGNDLFWGSILVELRPGLEVPIPSVAPNMEIMSYETTPSAELVFSKDNSDNYYVRSDESGTSGQFRLVFLVQAPARYFAPKGPSKKLKLRDIPRGITPRLPENVQKVANEVISDMQLHRQTPVHEALNKLVKYFRGFDAKSPPAKRGNIYWDLYKNQAGVCRHRSFAFMITANGLGIPTRYITNEAHAWVEVWLPESDWMRIDLGGAASTLNVENASDKSMYRPRGEDPFDKPDNYKENYTRLEGDVRGLRDDQIAERQEPYEGSGGGSEGNGSFFGDNADDTSSELEAEDEGPRIGPGRSLRNIPESELVGKERTAIRITKVAAKGYRGDAAQLSGVVRDPQGRGIPGLHIDLYIAPSGNGGNDYVDVGSTVSDDEGNFEANFIVPADVGVGAYEVFVSTPGNSKYQPALSP